jgi:hypothetical protein
MSPTSEAAVCRFVDDDAGYLEWMSKHATGFVLNCARTPSASYLMLHRATCPSINGEPARGRLWTDQYIKVCSPSLSALQDWARARTGGIPKPCGMCHP